jgi:thioredoxin-like negative regulator of GroEL
LDRPSTRLIGTLGLAASNCYSGRDVNPIAIEHAFSETPDAVEADVIEAIESVAHIVRSRGCEGLTAQQYARTLVDFAERLQQSGQLARIWRIRYHAARLFQSANQPEMAVEQAEAAWAENPDELPIGLLVAQLYAELGNLRFAQEIVKIVGPQISEADRIGQRALTELQQTIAAGSRKKK